MDVVKLANTLGECLQDVQRPSCCPLCMRKLSVHLREDDGYRTLEAVRIQCHPFWTACIAMLSTPRSVDDLYPLAAHFALCERRCPRRASHSRDIPFTDRCLVFFDAAYDCMYHVLELGRNAISNRRGANQGFQHRRGAWPTGVDELFPSGHYNSIGAHIFWCSRLFSPHPLNMIMNLLGLRRSVVAPYLLQVSLQDMLMGSLVLMLDPDIQAPPSAWPTGNASVSLPPNWRTYTWFDGTKGLRPSGVMAAAFFQFVEHGPDRHIIPEYMTSLILRYHHVLYYAVDGALSNFIRHREEEHELAVQLAQLAVILYNEEAMPEVVLHPRAKEISGLHRITSGGASAMTLIVMHIHQRWGLRKCFAPWCKVEMQDGGRPLKLCNVCQLTRYCDKECQRRDWKQDRSGEVPNAELCPAVRHKELCPALCRLRDQLGGWEAFRCTVGEGEQKLDKLVFEDDDLSTLVRAVIWFEGTAPADRKMLLQTVIPAVQLGLMTWPVACRQRSRVPGRFS